MILKLCSRSGHLLGSLNVCSVRINERTCIANKRVCEVGTVGKISDYQPEGHGFNPRPGRGLNFGIPSFATPSVDRDVKPLV